MELKVRERQAWRREFDGLGASRVRNELTLTRWSREKRDFARKWLEGQDIAHWQQNITTGAGPRKRINRRVLAIVAGVVLGGFALIRLLRQFF